MRAGEGGGGESGFSEFKTRFGPHSLDVDEGGRVWTLPRVAGGAPGTLDVFDADGAYSTSVDLGVPADGFRIRGDRLVVASETAFGEPVVRVYRIVR